MASTTTPASTGTTRRAELPWPAARRVRVPQLALGVLLACVAALGFVLFHAASVQRAPVLALATDVERGQVLAAEHLRVVHVGSDDVLAVTPADRSDLLVGRAAITDLQAGTLVTVEQVAAGATLTPGAGVVGLALSPGQYPTPRLAIGDLVTVVEVANGLEVLVETAEVVGVEPVGTQGQRFVSLQAGETPAAMVAAAAATGEVRLVLIDRQRDEGGDR
jgi:hypothetical protein